MRSPLLSLGADVAGQQIVDGRARRLAVVKHGGDLARDRHVDAEPVRQIARDAGGADALRDVPEPAEDVRQRVAAQIGRASCRERVSECV